MAKITLEKSKNVKKKTDKPKKRGATFSELVDAIRAAEAVSLFGGTGQVYFDPKTCDIWSTEFKAGDKYLKGKKTENYVVLWEAKPKDVREIFDKQMPDESSDEFKDHVVSYLEGILSWKFDPEKIAEEIVEKFEL